VSLSCAPAVSTSPAANCGSRWQPHAVSLDPRNSGAAMAIEHYRAFLRFGAVTHADLVGSVRARLAALGSG